MLKPLPGVLVGRRANTSPPPTPPALLHFAPPPTTTTYLHKPPSPGLTSSPPARPSHPKSHCSFMHHYLHTISLLLNSRQQAAHT